MIIDSSAMIAILQGEPEEHRFLKAIDASAVVRMSMVTYVESSMVIESRRGSRGVQYLEQLIAKAKIELLPVDREQAEIARSAFSRFGKGRHRAGLNLGDCFSYAAAIALGEPLLAKGDDFIHTGVRIAGA